MDLVNGFEVVSIIPLLEAASVSPTAAHRGPSIAKLFNALAKRTNNETRTAAAADLPALIARVRAAHPEVVNSEDFRPYDARLEVLVRWGPSLFRLLPGSLERPTAVINYQVLLASVIDPVLVPRLGFGLFDAGDLVLRRIDHVARSLTPYWSAGPAAEVGDDPHVTQVEVDAAFRLMPPAEIRDCVNPEHAAAAAARYTPPGKDLRCNPLHPVSTFQTAIATRIRDTVVPIPAGFLIESLMAIGADLATQAYKIDPKLDAEFNGTVGDRIGSLFLGSGQSITGPIWAGSEGPIHSLITFNDRQILVLDVAAGLTPAVTQARLGRGARALARIKPSAEVRTPGGIFRLPADAEVVRAQVITGPHHALLGTAAPTLTLEDLEWIVHSAHKTPEDLWYFVRDLENPHGVQTTFAWDLIDRWEVWRQQKSFYRGGVSLTTMMFSPHAAIAEWEAAAAHAPTERALHTLKLPPLRDWPIVDFDFHERTELVGDLHTNRIFLILDGLVPAAISTIDPTGPSEFSSTLWDFAVGTAWKLEHSHSVFVEAAERSGLHSLRIVFLFLHRESGPPLTIEGFMDDVLSIGWDTRLQVALAEDSFAIETLCGEIVSQALAPQTRSGFLAAWEAAPPGIRIDGFTVPQRVQHLPEPISAVGAVRSNTLRQLGEFLAASGIEPTEFEGAAATRLESDTIFPWLVSKFHEATARLSSRELLEFALFQLECASHHRSMLDRQLGWERGFPVEGDADGSDRRESSTRATRVISFMVEEVLAHPSMGAGRVDNLAWINMLSVAELCIESCFRSDSIHHQLSQTSLVITDLYEVNVIDSHEATDVDMHAYTTQRSLGTRPRAVPIVTGQSEEPTSSDSEPRALLDSMPELSAINDAMRVALGFGLDAVTGVLNIAIQWDADSSVSATRAMPTAIVAQCVELAVGATRDEYAAALNWLTLRGADLTMDTIPHWETERRAKRITTSPFVDAGQEVWVLPWTAESTLRIVANYLEDGRLPWPNSALPITVNKAVDQYRQRQNRELEKECVAALETQGFAVRGGVKPEKARRFGIARLSGEIDVLCIDIPRSRIWVIEAKDPFIPYSSRQIRRLINDFNQPGKYVDKLLRKVSDIADCAVSVAAALDVPDPTRGWVVLGLMVTRHVEPAAFAINPRVPICVLEDIVTVVDRDLLPRAGMHKEAPLDDR